MDLNALMAMVTGERSKLAARSGKNNTVKPPPGKSTWRILPGWRKSEEMKFFHEFGTHWIKENKQVKGVVICQKETFNEDCECCNQVKPIFTQMKAMGLTKDDQLWKDVSELNANRCVLVNALRMDGDNKNIEQPLLLELKSTVLEAYLAQVGALAAYNVNILSLSEGRDIIIERTGTGYDTKYALIVAPMSTAVKPEVMEKVIDIDAWIQGEVARNSKPGTLVADAARLMVTGTGASVTPRTLTPPASSLVPALTTTARTIKDDEPSVQELAARPATVVEAKVVDVPAKPVVAPAPAPSFSGAEMSAEELDDLISRLGD